MRVTLEDAPLSFFQLTAENGESVFFQSDWDFPRLAMHFGWVACPCGGTDGTIACPHRNVSEMIPAARAFLEGRIGESIENPGYF